MFTSRLSKQSPRTSARPQDPNFLPQWLPDGSFSCRYGVLTPDEVQLARANFVEFDVDRDGVISRMDFHMAMARHSPAWAAPAKRGQLDAMYAAVDPAGDGRVSFVDFAVMRVRKKAAATPRGWGTPRGRNQPPVPQPPTGAGASQNDLPARRRAAARAAGRWHGAAGRRDGPPRRRRRAGLAVRGRGDGPPRRRRRRAGADDAATARPRLAATAAAADAASRARRRHRARRRRHRRRFADVAALELAATVSNFYYRAQPSGDGWMPVDQLCELLCAAARSCAMPLSGAHAAMLCEQADDGATGWANVHTMLAASSFQRYFSSLQARSTPGGASVPPPAARTHAPLEHDLEQRVRRRGGDIRAEAAERAYSRGWCGTPTSRRRRRARDCGNWTDANEEAAARRGGVGGGGARTRREDERREWEASLEQRIAATLRGRSRRRFGDGPQCARHLARQPRPDAGGGRGARGGDPAPD